MASPSRLKSSTTLKVRKRRSPHNASLISLRTNTRSLLQALPEERDILSANVFCLSVFYSVSGRNKCDRHVCDSSHDPGVAAAGTTYRTLVPVVAKPAPTAILLLVHRHRGAARSDRPSVLAQRHHKRAVHSIHVLFVKQQPAHASQLASELFCDHIFQRPILQRSEDHTSELQS